MSDDLNGEEEEIRRGPLSPAEIQSLRHMINDYFYRRRVSKMFKVWFLTIGTVATVMVASTTIWKEIVLRLFIK